MAFRKTKKTDQELKDEINARQMKHVQPPKDESGFKLPFDDDTPPTETAQKDHKTIIRKPPVTMLEISTDGVDSLLLPYSDLLMARTEKDGQHLVLTFTSGFMISCVGKNMRDVLRLFQQRQLHCLEPSNNIKRIDIFEPPALNEKAA